MLPHRLLVGLLCKLVDLTPGSYILSIPFVLDAACALDAFAWFACTLVSFSASLEVSLVSLFLDTWTGPQ